MLIKDKLSFFLTLLNMATSDSNEETTLAQNDINNKIQDIYHKWLWIVFFKAFDNMNEVTYNKDIVWIWNWGMTCTYNN
jgi:hypothetical protein